MPADGSQRIMLLLDKAFVPVRVTTWLLAVASLLLPVSHGVLPLSVTVFVWMRVFTSCVGAVIGSFWWWEFRLWDAKCRRANPVRFFMERAELGARRIVGCLVAFRLADFALLWIMLATFHSYFLIQLLRRAIDARRHPEKYSYPESISEETKAMFQRWRWRLLVLLLFVTINVLWLYVWRGWIFTT